MQKAIRKTEQDHTTYQAIKCQDYSGIVNSGYYKTAQWLCDKCNILYSPEDVVILKKCKKETELQCPNKVKTIFQPQLLFKKWLKNEKIISSTISTCSNKLYSGTKEYFEEEYHLSKL